MVNILNEDFDFGKKYQEYLYRKGFVLKSRIFAPSQTIFTLPFYERDIFFSYEEYKKYKERPLEIVMCQFSVLDKLSAPISSKYMLEQLSLLIPEGS